MYAKKLRLGWSVTWILVVASLVGGAGLRRAQAVDTFISGFNGDLSSTLGVNWVLENGWTSEFVPTLSEGTGALKVYSNEGWFVGLKLVGGAPLANLIINNDTLEVDVIGSFGMSYRNLVFVQNTNFALTVGGSGFHQSPEIPFGVPSEAQPFNHIVLNLNAPINGKDWKQIAQGWLNDPQFGGGGSWMELMLVIQSVDNPLAPDFEPDRDVDGQDFLIWQRNFGNDFAGPDQGDANLDLVVDSTDFGLWAADFGRRQDDPVSIIDNIKFVDNTPAAAIPEPTTMSVGLMGAALVAYGARRRRRIA